MHRAALPRAAAAILASCLAGQAHAATFKTIYSIPGSNDGSYPQAGLVAAGTLLYGTTQNGGIACGNFFSGPPGCGTVFSFNPATGARTLIHAFTGGTDGAFPQGPLISAGGMLYGTNAQGGDITEISQGYGTVFRIDPATGAETVLYAFKAGTDGCAPAAALVAVNGTLYGTTTGCGTTNAGTVFSINPATGAETMLYTFPTNIEGYHPTASVVSVNGVLYGTTTARATSTGNWGQLFSLNPATRAFTILHVFTGGADGGIPGNLVALQDTLYGTTVCANCQSANSPEGIFGFDTLSGTLTPVGTAGTRPLQFVSQPALTVIDGLLYGTTVAGGTGGFGTIFSVDPTTDTVATLYSFTGGTGGGSPQTTLANVGGVLYGTASCTRCADTPVGAGAVFAFNPAQATEAAVSNFNGPVSSKWFPDYSTGDSLLVSGKTLLVTSVQGGAVSDGIALRLNPATGAATPLHAFTGAADGAFPVGGLAKLAGELYGTAYEGGTASKGVVFKLDRTTGAQTILHVFQGGSDGANPQSGLLRVGKDFYGTTEFGGSASYNAGSVFKLNPATGAVTIVYAFKGGTDGGLPAAGLTNIGGMLYGTTLAGGFSDRRWCSYAQGCGTVFSLDPATGVKTTLHIFQGYNQDGGYPAATLINVGGTLYGATWSGGTYNKGTVYSVNPATGATIIIHSLGGPGDGGSPAGSLVDIGGTLYGTTAFDDRRSWGTLFQLNLATGAEKTLHVFDSAASGGWPSGTLVNLGGTLYGATSFGGAANLGTVFSFKP